MGAATMNTMRSTSITSTSGVTLMSDMAARFLPYLPFPVAIMRPRCYDRARMSRSIRLMKSVLKLSMSDSSSTTRLEK